VWQSARRGILADLAAVVAKVLFFGEWISVSAWVPLELNCCRTENNSELASNLIGASG
jgi:hypothetical protein